jgi:tRNA uridine 5-carbamoylmethylation protein Kti12
MPTLILITGYARSGKDTFADGLASAARRSDIAFFNYADGLKDAANKYLAWVGQISPDEIDFHNDEFKAKNREVLVALGKMSRSIDVNVFARMLTNDAIDFHTGNLVESSLKDTVVISSDWRYLNEYKVAVAELSRIGWRIITVRIDTTGTLPANEEEALSIAAIAREMPTDYQYYFNANSAEAVKTEGKGLARILGL